MHRPGKNKLRVVLVQINSVLACVPLGLGYLKTYAESHPRIKSRTDIRIVQFPPGQSGNIDRICATILRGKPDLIGFTCFMWNIRDVIRTCKRLKKIIPRAKIILGGPEAGSRAEELLNSTSADFVATGEGETAFSGLLEAMLRGEDAGAIRGLACRGNGNAPGPPAARIMDLDSVPSPHLDGCMDYRNNVVLLETLRGCPFRCAFCTWNNNSRVRYFSLKRLERELRRIASVRSRGMIVIIDSDMCINREHGLSMLKLLERVLGGTDWLVVIESRLENWNREMLRSVKTVKMNINCGIQSIDPKVLKIAARAPFDRERFENAVRYLHSLDTRTTLAFNLIFGLPGDTLDGFKRTLDCAFSMSLDYILAFRCLVLPGSGYWQRRGALGIVSRMHPPYSLISTPGFPARDVRKAGRMVVSLGLICGDASLRKEFFEAVESFKRSNTRLPYIAALKKVTCGFDPGRMIPVGDAENNGGRSQLVGLIKSKSRLLSADLSSVR